MRGVLRGLVSTTSRMTVVDLEAGLEHLSRGTARHVDTLLLIAEPYFKSLEAAQRSFALATDLGIGQIYMVANKIRSPRDEDTVREFAGRHAVEIAGVIPYDPAVRRGGRARDRRDGPAARGDQRGWRFADSPTSF